MAAPDHLPGFHLTKAQLRLNTLISSDATHVMAYGGSRSGKTFDFCRALATRAVAAAGSRHAVFRYRFNHIKTSIISDTWPKMMSLCYPKVDYHIDRSDWFCKFPNGSEVWFSGLDDKERTEKVLGQEYASIFFNESSQIPWASRNMAITRLAQNVRTVAGKPLRLKAFYDCNPPSQAHWTYKLFVQSMSPDTRQHLSNPENFGAIIMNPLDNLDNLPPEYIEELKQLPVRERRRFFEGIFGDVGEGLLWTPELCDQQRRIDDLPNMQRVIVAVDPSGASGDEGERSDEVGIVVVGLGTDGEGYIIEDLSGKFGPEGWGRIVVAAFRRHAADMIVGEVNYGGDMVAMVIRATDPDVGRHFKKVHASRGKVVRAEPVSTLFESQKIWLAGVFPVLEEQMCAMTVSGYTGDRSPDRLDAMVWGVTELFPAVTKQTAPERVPRIVTSRPDVRVRFRR